MTTTRRGYVFGTFLSSCAALVLLIVSCATNEWIDSKLFPIEVGAVSTENKVNYGLFRGTYEKALTVQNIHIFDISITCDFGNNVCVWSCAADSDLRKSELSNLLEGGRSTTCTSATSSSAQTSNNGATRNLSKDGFINAGLWLSTVIFLMLALLATTVAALLAVFNTASNPSRSWLAVESLYYWNGATACLDLLCLILWGSLFASSLKDSIALNEVISESYTSKGQANLGWSYWLLLIAFFISIGNVGVLFWRDYLIKREPPPPTYNPEKEVADGTLFLY